MCVCVRISFFANVSRSRRKVFVIFQNAEGACSVGLVGFGEVKWSASHATNEVPNRVKPGIMVHATVSYVFYADNAVKR